MNSLALASIAFGTLIVAGRAPLIFAPEASLGLIQKLLDNEKGIRIMGIFVSLAKRFKKSVLFPRPSRENS